jgi:hypothetical protein
MESLNSCPSANPPALTAVLTGTTEFSSRFSKAEKKHACTEHGTVGAKSSPQEMTNTRKERNLGGMPLMLRTAEHKTIMFSKETACCECYLHTESV